MADPAFFFPNTTIKSWLLWVLAYVHVGLFFDLLIFLDTFFFQCDFFMATINKLYIATES